MIMCDWQTSAVYLWAHGLATGDNHSTYASVEYGTLYLPLDNQATGYASQHILVLSQVRITWEGCGRNGIRRKNGGIREVGC